VLHSGMKKTLCYNMQKRLDNSPSSLYNGICKMREGSEKPSGIYPVSRRVGD